MHYKYSHEYLIYNFKTEKLVNIHVKARICNSSTCFMHKEKRDYHSRKLNGASKRRHNAKHGLP